MKNVFFINPAAGQGKGIDDLIRSIEAAARECSEPYEIYMTTAVGDGEREARRRAGALAGEPARFFACGGDGTNNEIINGIIGYENIIAGCVPVGSGNDFVRSIPDAGDFRSIRAQLKGSAFSTDLIRYSGILDGRKQTRYCANMFNIGFDCNVVALAAELKKKPLIAGSFAYLLAVFVQFARKTTIGLRITEDGRTILDENVLLCAISNGCCCGGGMRTAPQSVLSDGSFDLNIVRDVTRLEFLKLFPSYKAGKHLERKGIEATIRISRHKKLSLTPKEGSLLLCTDGEICRAGSIEFEIVPNAVRFNVPRVL